MTSRLIFMTSCDCETYYLYCAICQQTSEHLRINNVSPFFPSIGLTALSASFSSFSSSSSKWQFTLSKLWGFPIGATGQCDLFSFSFFPTLPERVVEVHQDSVFHCMNVHAALGYIQCAWTTTFLHSHVFVCEFFSCLSSIAFL